ncbi:response regulator [Desulfolutivibrio sulfoxidireducens]|uniref:response regulator n=1 Tax=Desulfolutivibrio sulfoxidireducens TaxID=2773299 RepID=UPI00159CF8F0|nr:response regulator [Desulfolutivibrio sulfoxidireducens]QLA15773.1 response regulator [Desulfolutivibrio sulfoxidireducens]QLA19378.1 response regulator [Desulfolutivibrio sulfoxidireducens]
MDDFTDFRKKDFLEQVTLLRQAETQKDVSAIPALFALHAAPLGDQSVDLAVINVLQSLLAHGEAQAVAGLSSESPALRRLCLRTVGRYEFASALPVLLDMAAKAKSSPEDLQEILSALSRLRAPESLPVFRAHLDHADPYISALCAEMLGFLGDAQSLPRLAALVDAAEVIAGDDCPITVFKAVGAFAAIGGNAALSYLAQKIHHRNPTARRAIHETLVAAGEAAVPFVAERFHHGDPDERVLSANVLGFIGHKSGADVLVAAQDRQPIDHHNLRFAVYEALGRAASLKGLIFLIDGLAETDPMLLLAVVTALEANANPGVVKKIEEILGAGGPQARLIARAMADAMATGLFSAMAHNPRLTDLIVSEVTIRGDPETMEAFATALSALDAPEATAHAARLRATRTERTPAEARRRVLAVDDSRAMLAFYKRALPGMGFSTVTAEDGQSAWDILDGSESFDLIVADMNMPGMDGIELTRLVRGDMIHADTPVLMATTESTGEQVELAQRAGVTSFLKKPFTAEALRDELTRILG